MWSSSGYRWCWDVSKVMSVVEVVCVCVCGVSAFCVYGRRLIVPVRSIPCCLLLVSVGCVCHRFRFHSSRSLSLCNAHSVSHYCFVDRYILFLVCFVRWFVCVCHDWTPMKCMRSDGSVLHHSIFQSVLHICNWQHTSAFDIGCVHNSSTEGQNVTVRTQICKMNRRRQRTHEHSYRHHYR